jgi:ribosomal protein S21|tara:strand:+ start:1899 stop:2135 length:237 start_codon:yes stop_codon:yes gene_type:complete
MIKKPYRERQTSRHIEVEVKGDVMKAWRKMKKKMMTARTLEEVKERRYFQKPSIVKREYEKRLKRQAAKNKRLQEEKF